MIKNIMEDSYKRMILFLFIGFIALCLVFLLAEILRQPQTIEAYVEGSGTFTWTPEHDPIEEPKKEVDYIFPDSLKFSDRAFKNYIGVPVEFELENNQTGERYGTLRFEIKDYAGQRHLALFLNNFEIIRFSIELDLLKKEIKK